MLLTLQLTPLLMLTLRLAMLHMLAAALAAAAAAALTPAAAFAHANAAAANSAANMCYRTSKYFSYSHKMAATVAMDTSQTLAFLSPTA